MAGIGKAEAEQHRYGSGVAREWGPHLKKVLASLGGPSLSLSLSWEVEKFAGCTYASRAYHMCETLGEPQFPFVLRNGRPGVKRPSSLSGNGRRDGVHRMLCRAKPIVNVVKQYSSTEVHFLRLDE